ncbi:LlaJI family restriction endonuclease [Erysipelothrix rhusiopathiae]|nr:LlaJI family restriction endonuclease [Erysipelothrix rhusiopathiae]MDE8079893.1 LlaJI family restriction endonuclease [Erysipelothrix rhusiopathiae]MDE8084484.1 LlaJI family restriction endonuclease [Erysipelothrix rhusiopathiae]MDE8088034.1 LlaJI family restriction endonuclease [Erysipelothrix rhusiopathiae]MDE8095018.1 LlaJI family restriction endonuclease [Erysipelothrix rhusiopathiae]
MEEKKSIKERCHVNTNEDGDRFVGIKANSEDAVVYFPLGYKLPESEADIRRDIKMLISVLSEYTEKKDRVLQMKKFEIAQSVDFPINAYLEIINYYFSFGYYTENDPEYVTSSRGKADWPKTFKNQRPLIQQNGSPVYTQMTVKKTTPNDNKLITKIHKYCVYECFDKIGWLYVPNLPEKADIAFNKNLFLSRLTDAMSNTFNDNHKRLFKAMIDVIKFLDEKPNEKEFFFGTDVFEYVWEKLIDKVFGIDNKQDYFPKTKWTLRYGHNRINNPLEPDTIMVYKDKVYVLDAKFYRYGAMSIPSATKLPHSSDINKQITYGQYINNHPDTGLKTDEDKLFNAFIMPFNQLNNAFGITEPFGNIGEATGDWIVNPKQFERIQGIVVDVRYLMKNRVGQPTDSIIKLAKAIEEGLATPI